MGEETGTDRRGGAVTCGIIGCLVVPLAVVGVVAAVGVRSGEYVSSPEVDGRVVWRSEAPEDGTEPSDLVGSWVMDGLIVRVDVNGLFGYAADDGAVRWSMPTEDGLCAMSEETSEGVGVVMVRSDASYSASEGPAHGTDRPCDTAVGVDLRNGERLWTRRHLLGEGVTEKEPMESHPAVAGSSVVVAVVGELVALDLHSGRTRWERGGFEVEGTGARRCPVGDVRARDGETVVAVADCGIGTGPLGVRLIDAEEGRETGAFRVERPETRQEAGQYSTVLATDPIVLGVMTDLSDVEIAGFDDDGTRRFVVDGANLRPDSVRGTTFSDNRPDTLVENGLLWVVENSGDCTSTVFGYDLRSGEKEREVEGSPAGQVRVVAVEDDRLILMARGKEAICFSTRAPQLYTAPVSGGELEPLSPPLEEPDIGPAVEDAALIWRDHRIHVLPSNAYGPGAVAIG
ncbi:hypothetical protein HDA32_003267 [Spinactinospora alkalitolerans]|uniref:Pyrrolo-quinoline quinone repeat domain-containing protein n=1 Tax=Spinactinospora alkalitolerans TaxID=687207 RepID=A0A852TXY7_9ACTN|nr:PQQ-binding-like beta-propeller repeat protein [Spinactinospora alkalitolerans]NYE48147.1 hypothetical protein [Spinactinospora alkalitolerans]